MEQKTINFTPDGRVRLETYILNQTLNGNPCPKRPATQWNTPGLAQRLGIPEEGIKPNAAVIGYGAAPDSDFVHIGISPNTQKGGAKWLGPVTEAEYMEAAKGE